MKLYSLRILLFLSGMGYLVFIFLVPAGLGLLYATIFGLQKFFENGLAISLGGGAGFLIIYLLSLLTSSEARKATKATYLCDEDVHLYLEKGLKRLCLKKMKNAMLGLVLSVIVGTLVIMAVTGLFYFFSHIHISWS